MDMFRLSQSHSRPAFFVQHRILTRLTPRVPQVEQEVFIHRLNMGSPRPFVRVQSVDLYVVYGDHCLPRCSFYFSHCSCLSFSFTAPDYTFDIVILEFSLST